MASYLDYFVFSEISPLSLRSRKRLRAKCSTAPSLLVYLISSFLFGQFAFAQPASVDGQVRHRSSAPIAGATVTFQAPGEPLRRTHTNKTGVYSIHNLAPDSYSVLVEARGFQAYELHSFKVTGARNMRLDVKLDLAPVKQEIVVSSGEKPLSVETESSASSIRLRGVGLLGLPDDLNDFAAAVQALAGPSALGPYDPQLFINGFLSNQMPPKETISEIRINENPFSAENDRPATNIIEALTKTGGKQLHGEGYFNYDAGWWDTANPFTRPLPPNSSELYGGNVAGPLGTRASFFVSLERNSLDLKNAVSATVLNSSFQPVPFGAQVPDPEGRLLISPQMDLTLNKTNTMMVRYSSSGYSLPNEGVGAAFLPQSGYRTSTREQTAQVTETAVLSSQSVDETKLQFLQTHLASKASVLTPAIAVDQAFTSGSSPSALNSLRQNQWELQNNLSNVLGHHTLRVGIRMRGEADTESLDKNRIGTFSFSQGTGPALGPGNLPLVNSQGALTTIPLTGLERYRRTVLFEQQGLSPSVIRLLGGGASSFSQDTGDPRANVRQYDTGVYLQDDWHIRPNLLLGAGIRYENQTNLHDLSNVGPRFSFAWAPFKAVKDPHTVIRGGVGVFYDRLDATLVLLTRHSQHPRWHNTTYDPSLLDLFPLAPSPSSLAGYAQPADTLQMGSNVKAPITLQETLSVEQQLPYKARVSVSFTEARTFRDLLLIDTAPFQQGSPRSLTLDSSGRLTERQLKVEVSNRFSKRVNLTSDYVLTGANSDTDGTTNPAANPNNLAFELGRSAKDIRHNFTLTGSLDGPWGLRLSPFVVASSSRPFNIITGQYQDADIPFTGRPVLAADPTQPDVIVTRYGAFQLNPQPGQPVIARNFGRGPAFFSASVRLSKTFSFGEPAEGDQTAKDAAAANEHHRTLVVSAEAINLTNHLNPGVPEGNLSSPQFGQASSLAPGFNFGGGAVVYPKQLEANRRLEVQLRFTF